MNWIDVIEMAAMDWYKEGYKPDLLVMHPSDYSDLRHQMSNMSRGILDSPSTVVGPNPMTAIVSAVGRLEVKISSQECEGEFLLCDSTTKEAKRFTYLEGGDGHQLIIDQPRVLAVKRSQLFLVRLAGGMALQHPGFGDRDPRWSESLLQQVSESYDIVIIFNDTHRVRPGTQCWPDNTIQNVVKDLELQNVGVADFTSADQLEAVQVWKKRIMEVGGRIKRVPNIKDINCFNVPGLTQGKHIFWCDADGEESLDIFPEKLKSFMDLAKSRESRSNW